MLNRRHRAKKLATLNIRDKVCITGQEERWTIVDSASEPRSHIETNRNGNAQAPRSRSQVTKGYSQSTRIPANFKSSILKRLRVDKYYIIPATTRYGRAVCPPTRFSLWSLLTLTYLLCWCDVTAKDCVAVTNRRNAPSNVERQTFIWTCI